MKTDFDEWLAMLAAANKGGSAISASVIKPAVRGDAWSCPIELPGDYSTATISGAIRSAPDSGSVLASFVVTSGTYDSVTQTTTFTASLAAGTGSGSTGILPADDDGDGVTALPAAFTITPSGGAAELLFGFVFVVVGKV